MKRLLFLLGCVWSVTLCLGQRPASADRGWKFRSSEYVGVSAGEMGSYGLFETVNGVYKGPWFAGLGVGFDYYRYRSLPLFVSVSRDLWVSPRKGGLFVRLDGGINAPWYTREFLPYGVKSSRFNPGVWWEAGLGYRWKLSPGSDKAVLVSAGYGVKKLSEKQIGQPDLCPACFIAESQGTYRYEYVNRVWRLAIGFEF